MYIIIVDSELRAIYVACYCLLYFITYDCKKHTIIYPEYLLLSVHGIPNIFVMLLFCQLKCAE